MMSAERPSPKDDRDYSTVRMRQGPPSPPLTEEREAHVLMVPLLARPAEGGQEGGGGRGWRGRAPQYIPPHCSSQHGWDEHAVIDVRERPVPEVVAQARYAYKHALLVRDLQLGLL